MLPINPLTLTLVIIAVYVCKVDLDLHNKDYVAWRFYSQGRRWVVRGAIFYVIFFTLSFIQWALQ